MREVLDSATFTGLTLWKTAAGWQASVTLDRQSWHVKQGETPSLAVLEALGERVVAASEAALPPLPY